jgi:hypothetical protein
MNNDSPYKLIIALWNFVNKEMKLPPTPIPVLGRSLLYFAESASKPFTILQSRWYDKEPNASFLKVIPVV